MRPNGTVSELSVKSGLSVTMGSGSFAGLATTTRVSIGRRGEAVCAKEQQELARTSAVSTE
jgi:hypothetical protein